jgi:hypothetical protein
VAFRGIVRLVANTPARLKIEARSSEELLDDLCLELRHVGCRDYSLPNDERIIQHVGEVSAIYDELSKRGAEVQSRLLQLSEQTKWNISRLLEDCLRYPAVVPYVREGDGIRRALRCQLCSKAERPPDAKVFWFCDGCMEKVVTAVQERTPVAGIILFRTYNHEARCEHADDNTVLVTESWSDTPFGVCEKCIRQELSRRGAR